MDTETPGRIDIIVFPSGGKEVIGRQAAYPPVEESVYMPKVQAFVDEHRGLEKPEKFTGRYTVKNDVCSFQWFDWAGNIKESTEQE